MECWKCGKGLKEGEYCPIGKRVYCCDCQAEEIREAEEEETIYRSIRHKRMVRNAIQILEDQPFPLYDFKEAIQAVDEFLRENPGRLRSSHEVVAAIVLIGNGIRIKPNARVGKARVDFIIKDYRCILEIDGYLHARKAEEDATRDYQLKKLLGNKWETVRIPTKYIEQNAKMLVTAIEQMLIEKRAGRL